MIGRHKLCGSLVAAVGFLSAAAPALADRDLRAAFADAYPGYEVLTLDEFEPGIVQFYRERSELFPDGRTPAWAPGDYDGDGYMDVAVLAKKRARGDICDRGLFVIMTSSGRILHSSSGGCVSSSDAILYHPPGHTIEYLTDRYDMPDATDEEMFAKKTLPLASVEHITWGTAAGVYYWNPLTQHMETNTTAD